MDGMGVSLIFMNHLQFPKRNRVRHRPGGSWSRCTATGFGTLDEPNEVEIEGSKVTSELYGSFLQK